VKEKTEKPKILIVSGYHPEETFAVKVGEALFQYFSNLIHQLFYTAMSLLESRQLLFILPNQKKRKEEP